MLSSCEGCSVYQFMKKLLMYSDVDIPSTNSSWESLSPPSYSLLFWVSFLISTPVLFWVSFLIPTPVLSIGSSSSVVSWDPVDFHQRLVQEQSVGQDHNHHLDNHLHYRRLSHRQYDKTHRT